MRTFILTSKAFVDTHIEFYFNEEYFIGYKIIGSAIKSAHEFSKRVVEANPTLTNFMQQVGQNYEIKELLQEITFDMFWDRYNEKIRSSKKRSQIKWNSMTKAEQIKCFNYLSMYFRNIPAGCVKKNCETYLNSELWNN